MGEDGEREPLLHSERRMEGGKSVTDSVQFMECVLSVGAVFCTLMPTVPSGLCHLNTFVTE